MKQVCFKKKKEATAEIFSLSCLGCVRVFSLRNGAFTYNLCLLFFSFLQVKFVSLDIFDCNDPTYNPSFSYQLS